MADEPAKKSVGRPRLDPADATINLNFRIPTKQYDALCGEASKQRVSLAALMRSVVSAKLKRS